MKKNLVVLSLFILFSQVSLVEFSSTSAQNVIGTGVSVSRNDSKPLIHPSEGQWANYTLTLYDSTGKLFCKGEYNITYERYISSRLIRIKLWADEESSFILFGWISNTTFWEDVDIITRKVEVPHEEYWMGWIETNITIGSKVNILYNTAEVVGSSVLEVNGRPIDCWKLTIFKGQFFFDTYSYCSDYLYNFWFDKSTGVLLKMQQHFLFSTDVVCKDLSLADTNIPIGQVYQHEIGISPLLPSREYSYFFLRYYLDQEEPTTINASVYNLGKYDETHVNVKFMVDDAVASSMLIPLLKNTSSIKVSFPWTPTRGLHNLTIYIVPMAIEKSTLNNIASEVVQVGTLIHPIPGQWANYTLIQNDPYGEITQEIGFAYEDYVSPLLINVTRWRIHFGFPSWHYFWNETISLKDRITCYSKIGTQPWLFQIEIYPRFRMFLSTPNATFLRSETIVVGGRMVDCYVMYEWTTDHRDNTTYKTDIMWWFDKGSGLLMKATFLNLYSNSSITLSSTNIPYGRLRLEVPYEHQSDAQWCGPASLTMLLRYYGIKVHVWDIAEEMGWFFGLFSGLPKNVPGTTLTDLKYYMQNRYPDFSVRIGKYSYFSEEIFADIRSNVTAGYPVILKVFNPVQYQVDPKHYVVVVGFNSTGVFVHDPGGILFKWIWGQIPYSKICVFMSYEELRPYIVVPGIIQFLYEGTFLVVKGEPSLSNGSLSIGSGSVWAWHDKPTTESYAYIDFDKGLSWKVNNHLLGLDPDDLLDIYFVLFNHKSDEGSFTVEINITGSQDSIVYYSRTYYVLVKAYNWTRYSIPRIYLKSILTKGQPYTIGMALSDSEGNKLENFSLPEFFYYVDGSVVQLQELEHKLYLHIYDAQGNHVGFDYKTNQTEIGITNSHYYDNMNGTAIIVLPSNISNYRIIVDAAYSEENSESYNLTLVNAKNGKTLDQRTMQSSIKKGEHHEHDISISQDGKIIVQYIPWWQQYWYMIVALATVCVGASYLFMKRRKLVIVKNGVTT